MSKGSKKPKGIWDIVDTVNDVFGKGKRPSDEFYGGSLGDFKDAVKTAAQFSAQAANPVLESYARNVALPQAGGQKANWKRFAGEQAIGAAAIGGSLAASKAIEQLVKSPIATRAVNKLTKQTVMLHGSPTQNLKTIAPTVGENRYYTSERGALGFYENPQVDPSGGLARIYATNEGSVYAVRGKAKSFIGDAGGGLADRVQTSNAPQKVVGEVKLDVVGKQIDDRTAAISKMLKQAGVKVKRK